MKKISLPKIGIRPVIDGRRMGVRESLEAQTMNMAKATAALISEKLRHACGARVGVRDCRYLHRRHGRVGRL
ncbi:hypothetical protein BCR59_24515 [Klebsiella pneumoniae]|nr:hypothetical protein BCR59_24515 [Klebsiella pneumoniae]